MRYTDPVFLVPSAFFHKHAKHRVGRGKLQMQFKASMEPGSRDRWSQWALPQAHVGSRILEILEDLTGSAALDQHASDLISLPGVLWLGRPDLIPTVRRRRAA